MKHHILILSKNFPAWHSRAGEETFFGEAIRNAFFAAGSKNFNYNLPPFRSRPMEVTALQRKLHTIRGNYDKWARAFEEIKAGRACLSVRQWLGKPYEKGSMMIELTRLYYDDGISLQKLDLRGSSFLPAWIDGQKVVDRYKLARNDGLDFADWSEWMEHYDLSQPMALINFTQHHY